MQIHHYFNSSEFDRSIMTPPVDGVCSIRDRSTMAKQAVLSGDCVKAPQYIAECRNTRAL